MPTDYVTAIYTQIKTLLTATGSPFLTAVKAGNCGWVDEASNPRPSFKGAILPADAVEMESFDYEGGDYGGSTYDEHYTAGQDVEDQTWVESDTHRFTLTLNALDHRMPPVNAAVQAVRRCLRLAGPDLGLPYVQRWSMSRRDTKETVKDAVRRRCVLTLSVSMATDGAGELE